MLGKHKPSIAILMGMGKRKDEDDDEGESAHDDYEPSADLIGLAAEATKAMREDNDKKVAKALCAFIDMHLHGDEAAPEPEEEEDT